MIVRRTCLLLVVLSAVACKGKDAPPNKSADLPPHPTPAPAPVVVPGDWAVCKAALEASPKVPVTKQVAALIAACRPCGDWTPLLTWATPTQDGGPKRQAIADQMLACKAYCDPNAKMRFLDALDDNRGKQNHAPWRVLGEFCKDALSRGARREVHVGAVLRARSDRARRGRAARGRQAARADRAGDAGGVDHRRRARAADAPPSPGRARRRAASR